jgi:hypothetical protein
MDTDDDFLLKRGDLSLFRRRACRCSSLPVQPESGCGCSCPVCGSRCTKCPGFGFIEQPQRRFYRIMVSVQSQIRRRHRLRGNDPGYVRLPSRDISAVLAKRQGEYTGHWSEEWINLGPPLRIFDVFVVEDMRRKDEQE